MDPSIVFVLVLVYTLDPSIALGLNTYPTFAECQNVIEVFHKGEIAPNPNLELECKQGNLESTESQK